MSDVIKIRCSSLPRLALCPGSLNACKGIMSKSSAVSESGTRTHAAIEAHFLGSVIPPLETRERLIADWFIRRAEEIISMHGGAKDVYPELEMSGQIADGVFLTGHADLIVMCNDGKRLVFDWKAGFAEVPSASRNIQLMGYAWLLSISDGVGRGIEAYLFSAGNKDNALTGTVYDTEAVRSAKAKLQDIVQSAVLRDVRNPSEDACKYCPAKCSTRCPETLEQIKTGAELVAMPDNLLPANKQEAANLRATAKQLVKLAEAYIDRIDDEVKANPEAWAEFFTLQSTGSTRTIKDAQAAYNEIVEVNQIIDAETFLSLVSLPIGKLEEACKPALKERGVPVKDQKMMIAGLLGDNLELKKKAMSVKEVRK